MDRNFEGQPEPGFFNGISREAGKIEGEFRDIERSHEQREADKYENREERYGQKEREDFDQGRFPDGEKEPGLISDVRRGMGGIEGEFRNVERNYEQHEANKHDNREERYGQKEQEDFNQGRYQ